MRIGARGFLSAARGQSTQAATSAATSAAKAATGAAEIADISAARTATAVTTATTTTTRQTAATAQPPAAQDAVATGRRMLANIDAMGVLQRQAAALAAQDSALASGELGDFARAGGSLDEQIAPRAGRFSAREVAALADEVRSKKRPRGPKKSRMAAAKKHAQMLAAKRKKLGQKQTALAKKRRFGGLKNHSKRPIGQLALSKNKRLAAAKKARLKRANLHQKIHRAKLLCAKHSKLSAAKKARANRLKRLKNRPLRRPKRPHGHKPIRRPHKRPGLHKPALHRPNKPTAPKPVAPSRPIKPTPPPIDESKLPWAPTPPPTSPVQAAANANAVASKRTPSVADGAVALAPGQEFSSAKGAAFSINAQGKLAIKSALSAAPSNNYTLKDIAEQMDKTNIAAIARADAKEHFLATLASVLNTRGNDGLMMSLETIQLEGASGQGFELLNHTDVAPDDVFAFQSVPDFANMTGFCQMTNLQMMHDEARSGMKMLDSHISQMRSEETLTIGNDLKSSLVAQRFALMIDYRAQLEGLADGIEEAARSLGVSISTPPVPAYGMKMTAVVGAASLREKFIFRASWPAGVPADGPNDAHYDVHGQFVPARGGRSEGGAVAAGDGGRALADGDGAGAGSDVLYGTKQKNDGAAGGGAGGAGEVSAANDDAGAGAGNAAGAAGAGGAGAGGGGAAGAGGAGAGGEQSPISATPVAATASEQSPISATPVAATPLASAPGVLASANALLAGIDALAPAERFGRLSAAVAAKNTLAPADAAEFAADVSAQIDDFSQTLLSAASADLAGPSERWYATFDLAQNAKTALEDNAALLASLRAAARADNTFAGVSLAQLADAAQNAAYADVPEPFSAIAEAFEDAYFDDSWGAPEEVYELAERFFGIFDAAARASALDPADADAPGLSAALGMDAHEFVAGINALLASARGEAAPGDTDLAVGAPLAALERLSRAQNAVYIDGFGGMYAPLRVVSARTGEMAEGPDALGDLPLLRPADAAALGLDAAEFAGIIEGSEAFAQAFEAFARPANDLARACDFLLDYSDGLASAKMPAQQDFAAMSALEKQQALMALKEQLNG